MHSFVAERLASLALSPLPGLLRELIAQPLLRARHTSQMDLDGLHHLLEESSHAVRGGQPAEPELETSS